MRHPLRERHRLGRCLILAAVIGVTAAVAGRPNFLLLTTDDQRADAAGYASGGAVITPGLDRLAARSVNFTRAYAAFALCSPSRAAILTGQYGSRNGINQLGGPLRRPADSVARQLRAAGYATAVSGKWHFKTPPRAAGFDWACTFWANGAWYGRKVNDNGRQVRPPELVDRYCAQASVRFLRERDRSRPFFLWHCTQLPHMDHRLSWPASRKSLARYRADEMPLPPTWRGDFADKPAWVTRCRNRTQARKYGYDRDPDAIRRHIRAYRAAITDMDDALEPLWRELDAQQLWTNTVVLFLGDNGWMLGEHGLTSKVLAYEPSARIPMLLAAPGHRGGRRCDRLVSNLDVAPTLLELAGLPVPAACQGRGLLPLLENPAAPWRAGFLYEGLGGYGGVPPMGAWITERWKVIHTWRERPGAAPDFVEIYDLAQDPAETANRHGAPAVEALSQAARRAFAKHPWTGE